jgi:4-oxalocrotonate tautomerase
MPILRLEMLSGRSREQKKELAEVLTRETARIAKCAPSGINVIFVDVEREDWAVNGILSDEKK